MVGARRIACLIALAWVATTGGAQNKSDSSRSSRNPAGPAPVSLSTQDRLEDMAWWPTKTTASRVQYLGTAECAKCHSSEAASQPSTEMAQASARLPDASFLTGEKLSFQQTPYNYEITRNGEAVFGTVADALSSISRPFLFAFGKGVVGRTFIYQWQGNWFESRVSYYSALRGLDLTTGHPRSVPSDLEQAMGRLLESREAEKCFGCHTTASTTSNHFDPNQSLVGITCEACHGPGEKHVQAMKTGQIERGRKSILNPASLNGASSVDFCGACHRTSGDVIQMSTRGVATVRFQPFRLEQSRCWSGSNGQLTCVECHNPHQMLVHDIAFYDRVCLRCHSPGSTGSKRGHGVVACREGKQSCVSCHMPKIEIPGMHHAFTDHWIRITKNDAPYPN